MIRGAAIPWLILAVVVAAALVVAATEPWTWQRLELVRDPLTRRRRRLGRRRAVRSLVAFVVMAVEEATRRDNRNTTSSNGLVDPGLNDGLEAVLASELEREARQ